jgi:hypothetical protein
MDSRKSSGRDARRRLKRYTKNAEAIRALRLDRFLEPPAWQQRLVYQCDRQCRCRWSSVQQWPRPIGGPQNGLPQTPPITPPATAPIGPATRRPVPAPAPAPTQSARAADVVIIAAAASAAVANKSFFICSSPDFARRLPNTSSRSEPARHTRESHKFVAKLGRIFGRPDTRLACTHAFTITRRSMSAMLLMPVSAMVTSSSLRMISMARATPASPAAPRP